MQTWWPFWTLPSGRFDSRRFSGPSLGCRHSIPETMSPGVGDTFQVTLTTCGGMHTAEVRLATVSQPAKLLCPTKDEESSIRCKGMQSISGFEAPTVCPPTSQCCPNEQKKNLTDFLPSVVLQLLTCNKRQWRSYTEVIRINCSLAEELEEALVSLEVELSLFI